MFALHNKAEFNRSLFFSRFNCFYQLNLHMRLVVSRARLVDFLAPDWPRAIT